MLRILFITSICALFITMTDINAYACSCLGTAFEYSFKGSNIVVSTTVGKKKGKDQVWLNIDEVWKGKAPKKVLVKIQSGLSSMCTPTATLQPDRGTEYLLYLGSLRDDGTAIIHLNGCGRNTYDNRYAKDDLPHLQAYRDKLNALDDAIKKSHSAKEQLYQKALFLEEYNDHINAWDILTHLLSDFPDYGDAWSLLSSLYVKKAENIIGYQRSQKEQEAEKRKYYLKALESANKALSLNPKDKRALHAQQIALLQSGQAENSVFDAADFNGQSIKDINLKNTQFTNSDFTKARFYSVTFYNTELLNASFHNAQFVTSSIIGSKFDEVEFNYAYFDRGDISECSIKNSSFNNAVIGITFKNCDIQNSRFSGATLRGGYSSNYTPFLSDSTILNTSFIGVKSESRGDRLTIKNTQFDNCDFYGAQLSVKLKNVNFTNSKLDDADLSGTIYDCQTKWPDGFDPVTHGAIPAEDCDTSNSRKLSKPDYTDKQFETAPDFQELDLSEVSFKNAKLKMANFTKSNLIGADFSNADLQNANFRDADLKNAKVVNANIRYTNFENTDLTGAVFRGSRFGSTPLKESQTFNDANLFLALIPIDYQTWFPTNFNPDKHNFIYTVGGRNQGSPLPCDLAPLKSLNLENQDLRGMNLAHTCLRQSNFKNANLQGVNLYATDLEGSTLDGAKLRGARYSCETRWPEGYTPDVTQMIFSGSTYCSDNRNFKPAVPNLPDIDLSGEILFDAHLDNANLEGANLKGTDLSTAHLSGTKLKNAKYDDLTVWPNSFNPENSGAIKE